MPHEPTTRDRLLDASALAELLGAHPCTVWRSVKEGRLPRPLYIAPTAPRWRESEVWAALEATRADPSESKVARRMSARRRAPIVPEAA
jgi:predicted DNA-binding transcriptional regulator AlpA